VIVADQLLESERIFIDTGARPLIPRITGLAEAGYLTNETIMELTELPDHLLILGGGYIGLEFGQMFCRFGSRVTVIHQGAQILPREDAEIAAELQRVLETEGIKFLLDAHTTGVEKRDGGWRSRLKQATALQSSQVRACYLPPGGCPIPKSWISRRRE
jgi:pyruvate/2-oxoglutarate dehydrogenase complex dihydrolipoamide dehydrogenase (E3) component